MISLDRSQVFRGIWSLALFSPARGKKYQTEQVFAGHGIIFAKTRPRNGVFHDAKADLSPP